MTHYRRRLAKEHSVGSYRDITKKSKADGAKEDKSKGDKGAGSKDDGTKSSAAASTGKVDMVPPLQLQPVVAPAAVLPVMQQPFPLSVGSGDNPDVIDVEDLKSVLAKYAAPRGGGSDSFSIGRSFQQSKILGTGSLFMAIGIQQKPSQKNSS